MSAGPPLCRMLGCPAPAAVRVEWPVTDGRACGDYCSEHAEEIRLNVVPDIMFVRLADGREGGPALAHLP
ncbi:MAG: hypothetical protein J2P45_28140, partial [Candidatus Dormibacteraeota bacterium]|nr:hypothetical protein [Candidatus Dormibacteraeota bacterium]